ncbi:ATP-binding protein [Domibacillus sp. PGB-M46]|uniref:ATP-binding protein n=1 Tax=Domibacillus sp. PGB-M46 TaxID=2910255 RepID=UPI001F56F562|nr:ATP-binding protein [Domibacillus sp. PGB-M46]MCI2256890.1 ATP-binding protein [Domibacillus sp. PGB-M46]
MSSLSDGIQNALLNIFIVYSCFTFYFKFIEGKTTPLTSKIIVTLVSAVSIIFCMSFPIINSAGYTPDFRQIPLIVGALYGGRRVAIILTVVMLTYRFYLDIPHFHMALLIYSLLLISIIFIIPFFQNAVNMRRKVQLAAIAALFGSGSRMALMFFFDSEKTDVEYLTVFITILFTQLLGVVSFVIVNERTRQSSLLSREVLKLEKLRTVSELAASISHEVRNPLTVTKGFVQLLREPGLSDEEKNRYAETALEALDKAEATITEYLTFAKPSLEDVKILDLHQEIIHMRNFVDSYAAMNSVEIEMNLTANIYIAGEDKKLHQCLINVIKNGIEAMPGGGKLRIDLCHIASNAIVTITDTGIGMNKAQLDRLGNPFFTTKDIGTGLGTMVVYSIVKTMGGRIKVDSEVGKGTRFTIFFPTVEQTVQPSVEVSNKLSSPLV